MTIGLEKRRRQWIEGVIRKARDRAVNGKRDSRHDSLLALAIELRCLERCPDLTTAERNLVDVRCVVRAVAEELGLLAEGRADEVERLATDGQRYAEDKEPARMPADLLAASQAAESAASAPAELPGFRGTLWMPRNGVPATKCPGDGEPWEKTWAEMAEKIAHPRPALDGTPKDQLPLICLAAFRDRTEAEACAEHEKRMETCQREQEKWDQRPAETRGAAPRRPAVPSRVFSWGTCYRHGDTFDQLFALALDLDNAGDATPERLREAFGAYALMAHTSYSHTPEVPCWRVFLPLARPVDRATGNRLIREWATQIVERHFKQGSRTDDNGKPKAVLDKRPPEQGWFVPCTRPGYTYLVNPGPALDPDVALAELDGEKKRKGQPGAPATPSSPEDTDAEDALAICNFVGKEVTDEHGKTKVLMYEVEQAEILRTIPGGSIQRSHEHRALPRDRASARMFGRRRPARQWPGRSPTRPGPGRSSLPCPAHPSARGCSRRASAPHAGPAPAARREAPSPAPG